MKKNIKKYIKEFFIFSLVLFFASNAFSYYQSLNLNKDRLNEKSFNLLDNSEYFVKKDKSIIIHFWATWCPTCKFEASNIEKISKDYEVITIASQSGDKVNIEKYLADNNLSFKVINDKNGELAKKFNVKAYPTTFIYDKNKDLKFTEVGYTSTAGLYTRMKFLK